MVDKMEREKIDENVDFQVLNAIADLVRVLDYKEKVVFVNKAMEDLLGYDPDKKVCILGADLFDPDHQESPNEWRSHPKGRKYWEHGLFC